MKKAAIVLSVSIICICLLTGLGCGKKGEKTVVLKLAHGLNTDHPVHKAMLFMAEKVKEKSAGKMRVDVYPSEQLGSERECIERLQIGGLAMTKTSSSPMESFVEKIKVLGLPYLFRDSGHYWKVLKGPIGKELLSAGESKGLKGVCFYDAGARSFYTAKKQIKTPADLAGMKIRVQKSPMAQEMVKTMGGNPTPIDWGELYTSLQQGVVDGAENNPPSLNTSRHYEICKYYSLDEHTRPPDMVLISTVVWSKLTAEQQEILQQAADESVEFQRKLWKEFVAESLDIVTAAGVTIIKPDKQPFRDAVKPMLEKYKDSEIGALARKIIEVQ